MGWLDKIVENKGTVVAGLAATGLAIAVGMYYLARS